MYRHVFREDLLSVIYEEPRTEEIAEFIRGEIEFAFEKIFGL